MEALYADEAVGQEILLTSGESLRVNNSSFAATVTEGLQPNMLNPLVEGQVSALHMKNAVDIAWCDQVAERFANHPSTTKEGVTPAIYSLGSHLYSRLSPPLYQLCVK